MALPPAAAECRRAQIPCVRAESCAAVPRLSSWRPDSESEQSSTVLMEERDGSGSRRKHCSASAIAANSAFMLLHTTPAGTVHSSLRFSRWSSRSAPPPPFLVPSLADPSDQIVRSGSGWSARASSAAAFRCSGGSVLLVGCGRVRPKRTVVSRCCHGGSPW